ncbi:hypothetical protein IFM89_019273 [Coptis chinensis]|uniref:2-C-methyl-D-erythritol 2,4-cyclodiphosphate synthase n=1 Tax=Coptis chinensis TaxID=261450 RepID=A0A835H6G9_9MAGN|nr:hypothetical protein IFM89_019273 [Coptis chinensis]
MAMAAITTIFSSTVPIKSTPSSSSSSSPFLHFSNNTKLSVKGQSFSSKRSLVMASANAAASTMDIEREKNVKNTPKILPFRVGHGFDLHRLELGYPLIIGGIDIPFEKGCEAHSDGDVLLHCVVDAILGALGLPDIGQIFPDNDPKWKGCRSSVFVQEAVSLLI